MKKGALHFLGRKTPSLFDTNVKMMEMDNVELVLDSSAIPVSGTASVRSRPTVKHFSSHSSSSDAIQGFAVPTPKVPFLPPLNGPKTNGTGSTERLSNGGLISVPDMVEGEILIPPPPSMAPPPPPPQFIPTPLEFFGNVSPDLASLQPPSMPPPKLPSLTDTQECDLASLKPPPMAPPKPPSDTSSAKSSTSISSTSMSNVPDVPECPTFTPPLPPVERYTSTLPKYQKAPPPKPVRMSSIPVQDAPPWVHALRTTASPMTPSSFNPQNTAKLYSVPKTSLLGGQIDREQRPKSILLLEDSSGKTLQVQVNGKAPVPPTKPARRNSSSTQLEKDLQDLKENLEATLPGQPAKTNGDVSGRSLSVASKDNTPQKVPTPLKGSPKLVKVPTASVAPKTSQAKSQEESPGRGRKFSPLLSHKLLNMRTTEGSGVREGVASPLALLMAAKEREKRSSTRSRENSAKMISPSEPSTVSIHPSEVSPNSFTVIPRSSSSSSLSAQERLAVKPKSAVPIEPIVTIQPQVKAQSTKIHLSKPEHSVPPHSKSSSSSSLVAKLPEKHEDPAPSSPSVRDEENGEDLCMAFIPPPPEFANSDPEDENDVEPPPSTPPPDPPVKNLVPPTKSAPPGPAPPTKAPSPPPKPKPPSPPKLPPPTVELKPILLTPTKPKPPPAQVPPLVSASQATLLSILQKKMLEMGPKFAPVKELDHREDDWGAPIFDEEGGIPVLPKPIPKNKTAILPPQSHGLDMRELETKVAKKAQSLAMTAKSTTSNGLQPKQPYGMTFTVRPGSKPPITPHQ